MRRKYHFMIIMVNFGQNHAAETVKRYERERNQEG